MFRVGIVGCGGIAQVHAWAINKLQDCTLAAVCDIEIERAKKLGEKYEVSEEMIFASYEEMLERGKPDAVHICTPHYLHVPMAVSALKRGIAVFMEKPAAISERQWEELNLATAASDAGIGFCFQNRYNVTTGKLDEIVAGGELGKVLGGRAFVTWRRDRDYYDGNPWKGRWETEGGGALINQSIHTLDLLLRYLGEPSRVEASLHNHHTADCIEVEDTVEAWMEFDGGRRACFYASNGYVTDAPILLELTCEKGSITLLDRTVLVNRGGKAEAISCEEHAGIGKNYWGGGHLVCIRDFYRCLESGESFQNDLEGVRNTVQTTLEIYRKGCRKE